MSKDYFALKKMNKPLHWERIHVFQDVGDLKPKKLKFKDLNAKGIKD